MNGFKDWFLTKKSIKKEIVFSKFNLVRNFKTDIPFKIQKTYSANTSMLIYADTKMFL